MEKETVQSIKISSKVAVIYFLRSVIGLAYTVSMLPTGLFRGNKDVPRRIYIRVNNILARYGIKKKCFSEMLILLPHCMQNKNCSRSITDSIDNCRRCGGCKIGEVADIAELWGIRVVVAKGGTAARNTVKNLKPDVIIAVACERELISGIGDVSNIPVIGVINQRPDGYCTNTTVDIQELRTILQELETRYDIHYRKFEDSSKAFDGISESTKNLARNAEQKNA